MTAKTQIIIASVTGIVIGGLFTALQANATPIFAITALVAFVIATEPEPVHHQTH